MDNEERGQKMARAIRAALETATRAGWLQASARDGLEATLTRLDERLGSEAPELHFKVETARETCLVVAHSSDPVALDVIGSFMHHAGAEKPGTAAAWLLPLDGIPVNRWVRALRRVIAAEQRTQGDLGRSLPVRLTVSWARGDDLVVADVT
jgi:hypothetical protein